MIIRLTTYSGLEWTIHDPRNPIYLEKRIDGFFEMQWYDEHNDNSDTRIMSDIATVEITND